MSRCAAEGCTERKVLVVGDCKLCMGQFCAEHRIPESHKCKGIISQKEDIAKKWVVARKDLASVAGLVFGTLNPKEGFR